MADIKTLSTDYNIGGSDCGGGAPRFEIDLATGKNIFVYFGPLPNFTNCFYGWQNTGNVVNATDKRWDTSQIGGTFYDTHANAVTLAGSAHIKSISVVVDAGWFTGPKGQDLTIDNFTVNKDVMEAEDAFPHGHDHE